MQFVISLPGISRLMETSSDIWKSIQDEGWWCHGMVTPCWCQRTQQDVDRHVLRICVSCWGEAAEVDSHLGKESDDYTSFHNHGSVKNGCISNSIVTFQTQLFSTSMLMGGRVIMINLCVIDSSNAEGLRWTWAKALPWTRRWEKISLCCWWVSGLAAKQQKRSEKKADEIKTCNR